MSTCWPTTTSPDRSSRRTHQLYASGEFRSRAGGLFRLDRQPWARMAGDRQDAVACRRRPRCRLQRDDLQHLRLYETANGIAFTPVVGVYQNNQTHEFGGHQRELGGNGQDFGVRERSVSALVLRSTCCSHRERQLRISPTSRTSTRWAPTTRSRETGALPATCRTSAVMSRAEPTTPTTPRPSAARRSSLGADSPLQRVRAPSQ